MKSWFPLMLALLLALPIPPASAQQRPVGAAPTPPLGWNSYNCFGSAVLEDEVKANAAYMARHLKSHGWQYVVVDFLWSYDNPPGSNFGNPQQYRLPDGAHVPWLTMDQWGRLLPQPRKFPSAQGQAGFKSLADYVHGQGLKFGIHLMRGIPRQAVWAKTPVLGASGITADMIADTTSTCSWNNHMYGLNMAKPGAQEYLNSLFQLYAAWDVDFVKVDDLSRPYHAAEVEGYRKAITQSGREMVFSLSPGETPVAQAAHVAQHGDMWRMADDFWDEWKAVLGMMAYARQWQGKDREGHWADCDMLQIGRLSKRGPVGPERYSRFTNDELYTHMTFWSIFRSPLMMGGNLPDNRELELKLLTNDEVLAVNQQGRNPRELYHKNGYSVWYSQAPGPQGGVYVALFNLNEKPGQLALNLGELGFKGKVKVRNLWEKRNLGSFKTSYGQTLNPHATALLLLTPE
ncbi:glycoside hydrolase family 27 protein [Hymenobacter weizhouensis]|uniref:glycoside hydrolase family 27 protein n=1 Tax=Hymenobacter sp. YIM 151500-1 TaxID=2987689 RepID=UPI002227E65E|nr:glycoside hydrolase family 27 protein [Hymenobacter sp. YIM 151500-1]UYZ62841.1 glycoside hydrolase family 27 protein [Hymenobacter sp. YIM 151500-1]